MYQPSELDAIINHARLNGHKEIMQKLITVQNEMQMHNWIETSSENVRLGWRGKCETELSLEDIL
jgi:hypothetical protein